MRAALVGVERKAILVELERKPLQFESELFLLNRKVQSRPLRFESGVDTSDHGSLNVEWLEGKFSSNTVDKGLRTSGLV